jgi:predicted RNase H-like HicB family nuclease
MSDRLSYEEVVQRIEAAWAAWLASLDGIDNDAMTRPGASGDWSPTDLLSHIAFWDEQAGFDIQFRHDNGEAPPPRDWQRMNEQEQARHAGRTPAEARRVMLDTHEALLLLAEAHRDDDLTWLAPELVDHYVEHTAEMRAWRAR